jgi:hypothetical protein
MMTHQVPRRNASGPSPRLPPPASEAGENPATQAEVCEYIADVSLQLRQMSQAVDLRFLTYLLEMVFEEAFTTSQKLRK